MQKVQKVLMMKKVFMTPSHDMMEEKEEEEGEEKGKRWRRRAG